MSKRQLANEFATKVISSRPEKPTSSASFWKIFAGTDVAITQDVVNRSPVAAQRSPTTVNESDEEDEGGGRGVFGRAGSAPKR
eukprot:2557289-Rhodomonas_salina.2